MSRGFPRPSGGIQGWSRKNLRRGLVASSDTVEIVSSPLVSGIMPADNRPVWLAWSRSSGRPEDLFVALLNERGRYAAGLRNGDRRESDFLAALVRPLNGRADAAIGCCDVSVIDAGGLSI
jgi:hypothetical protein